MAANLLELYSSIVVDVLVEWIHDEDVSRIDTACCNYGLRSKFLADLSKCFLKHSCWYKPFRSEWIMKRNIGQRMLHLSLPTLDDFDKYVLKKTSCLEFLAVNGVQALSEVLNSCKNIHSLELSLASDADFDIVREIRDLHSLHLSYSPQLTEGINSQIIEAFPELKYIDASHDVSSIIQGCTRLDEVRLRVCNSNVVNSLVQSNVTKIAFENDHFREIPCKIGSEDALQLFQHGSRLTSLALDNTYLALECFMSLAQHCGLLRVLHLGESSIDDESLPAICMGCKLLEDLEFNSMFVTDEGLFGIANHCHNLTQLKIKSNDDNIEDAGVLRILSRCSKLKLLDVFSRSVTDFAFMSAFSLCPTLEVLKVQCVNDPDSDDDMDELEDPAGQITSLSVVGQFHGFEDLSIHVNGVTGYKICGDTNSKRQFSATVGYCTTSITLLLMQNPGLIKLHMEAVSFKDSCMSTLAHYCPLLRDVSISSYCYLDTVLLLMQRCALLENLKFLEYDHLNRTCSTKTLNKTNSVLHTLALHSFELTDEILGLIGDANPMLRSVTLTNSRLKSEAIVELCRKCPLLSHLKLMLGPQIKMADLQGLTTLNRFIKVELKD